MAIDRQKQRTLLRLTNFGADTEKKITKEDDDHGQEDRDCGSEDLG